MEKEVYFIGLRVGMQEERGANILCLIVIVLMDRGNRGERVE